MPGNANQPKSARLDCKIELESESEIAKIVVGLSGRVKSKRWKGRYIYIYIYTKVENVKENQTLAIETATVENARQADITQQVRERDGNQRTTTTTRASAPAWPAWPAIQTLRYSLSLVVVVAVGSFFL